MKPILDKIRSLPQYQQLLSQLQVNGVQPGLGLQRAARLPLLAGLLEDTQRPILLITDRSDHALSLFDELGFYMKGFIHLQIQIRIRSGIGSQVNPKMYFVFKDIIFYVDIIQVS